MMRTAIDVTLAKPSPTAQQLTDTAIHVRRSVDRAETAGDPQLLERMIANLVGNAVRHNEPGG
jgi:signal transduction histidine kinase